MLYTYQKILRMHSPRLYSRTSQSWGRQLLPAAWSLQRKKAIRPDMTVPVQKMHSQVRTFHHWSNAYTVIQSLRKQPLTSQISKFLFAVCVSCFHICGSVFVHPGKIFLRGFLNLTPHRILSIIFKVTFINKALLTSGCSEKWPPLFSLEM